MHLISHEIYLQDLSVTSPGVQDLTIPHNHMAQDNETAQKEVITPITDMTPDIISDSSPVWNSFMH